MADSGAATAIANTVVEKLGASKAILVVILVCAISTYGGVSLFVCGWLWLQTRAQKANAAGEGYGQLSSHWSLHVRF